MSTKKNVKFKETNESHSDNDDSSRTESETDDSEVNDTASKKKKKSNKSNSKKNAAKSKKESKDKAKTKAKNKKKSKTKKSTKEDSEEDEESKSNNSSESSKSESDSESESDKSSESSESDSDSESNSNSESSDSESSASNSKRNRKSKKRKNRSTKSKSKSKSKRRISTDPPLPVNGNVYFTIMLVFQVLTVVWVFWASWEIQNSKTFGVVGALNLVAISMELLGFRTVIYEKFKDFTSLWKDKKQPAESKMNSVIKVTTTNTALMFVMFLIQGVTVITLACSIPILVLGDEVWSSIVNMGVASKWIFSLLLVSAGVTFVCVWLLTYSLLFAVSRGCVLLEANNYDRLIGEQFRLTLKKQFANSKPNSNSNSNEKAHVNPPVLSNLNNNAGLNNNNNINYPGSANPINLNLAQSMILQPQQHQPMLLQQQQHPVASVAQYGSQIKR